MAGDFLNLPYPALQYPEHHLFAYTVLNAVMFGPLTFGTPQGEAEAKAPHALQLVGLQAPRLYQRSPYELSGGQMRRVAIAGILAMEPAVLILDEPTAGLDPAGSREILELIHTMHQQRRMTTILVTHSMEDVVRYANQIVVMSQGGVVLEGTPTDIFTHADEAEALGLELPEILQFIQRINACGKVTLPTNLFRVEDLVVQIRKHWEHGG
ncbi:ATP-binding cassette domain-containing protein [Rubeoparvulum massiliense]|uniref:ATP-binding cassette domain-containing protein n=1 Tax=Rubeoparvulum massiliense TaxID=1631346 RepID=UPI00069E348D|nr:ATP-binding cassette domain-containing protein [Rubeoparvulum massiliense]